ncbi:MAG: cation:proton antiporter [Pseudomonadota bacterium]
MDFLSLAFLFLIAGVAAVPLATKFGLGSVLGYLIAGIAISPLLSTLNVDVISLQHFAEFGVVMMLFLVGLELEPKMLWHMRMKLLGLGGLQVVGTVAAVMGVCMLLGLEWSIGLAVGMVLALSSTAIVLQTLNEKGLMKSDGGESSFSVLLFQDIAVIPMLALIPLLAMPDLMETYAVDAAPTHAEAGAHDDHGDDHGDDHEAGHGGGGHDAHGDGHGQSGPSWIETLPGGLRALVTIGAIAAVIVGGSFLTRPIFRYIALAQLRELFTATALMMVIGIALLMSLVGLSPALGTFLAGVVLANSEYRHELESDIDPFKGLLLGLFFMTVGASIDFGLLFGNFALIFALAVGLIAIKAAILIVLAHIFNVGGSDKWLMALGLAQAGEFAFVLLSFTIANDVVPPSIADKVLLVVALSMLLTPGLFIFYDKVIAPRYAHAQARDPDEIDEEGTIIIAGHGRWGGIVNRMLTAAGYKTVVLDHSAEQLEMLRAFGIKVFYGDATRPDLLHAAGIHQAKILVVAIDDKEQATQLVEYVTQNHPDVYIIARAVDRPHVYDLYAAGSRDIVRETFDSGVRAGRSAFEALGVHPFEAEQMSRAFVDADRYFLRELATLHRRGVAINENPEYVKRARELRAELDAELAGEANVYTTRVDRGWSPPKPKDVEAEEEAAKIM